MNCLFNRVHSAVCVLLFSAVSNTPRQETFHASFTCQIQITFPSAARTLKAVPYSKYRKMVDVTLCARSIAAAKFPHSTTIQTAGMQVRKMFCRIETVLYSRGLSNAVLWEERSFRAHRIGHHSCRPSVIRLRQQYTN